MSQIIIDPTDHGFPTERARITRLPPHARDFGYIPDLRPCKAGDLVLSYSRSTGLLDRQIERTQQRLGFASDDSRWTHAAIFLYSDFVVEAVPGRVRTRSFFEDVPGSVLRVRRRPDLCDEDRYKIALSALRSLGARYSLAIALAAGWKALFHRWSRVESVSSRRAIVCSRVYFDAHVEITNQVFDDCNMTDLVTPAHLSATKDLEDVPIGWLKV